MIDLILEGECHNGHHARRLAAHHWRMECRGDTGHYSYYFHFTLRGDERPGEAVVDVAADGYLLPDSLAGFRKHRPDHVWLSRGDGWLRHSVAADAPADTVRIRVDLRAGESVAVSRMRPLPYSEILQRLQVWNVHPLVRQGLLGTSFQRRSIPLVEIGDGPTRILVLAGQHPAEFGGIQAVMGVGEWLLSQVPEARALRRQHTFYLLPLLNPDGNVEGRTGYNAEGIDLYRSFEEAAAGEPPQAHEARLLWDWVLANRLLASLNFHCYTQPSPAGASPWEGLYTTPEKAWQGDPAYERQRVLDDVLTWETDGLSQHGQPSIHVPGALEYQLAALGIPSALYEVQDALGPYHQRRTGVRVLRALLSSLT